MRLTDDEAALIAALRIGKIKVQHLLGDATKKELYAIRHDMGYVCSVTRAQADDVRNKLTSRDGVTLKDFEEAFTSIKELHEYYYTFSEIAIALNRVIDGRKTR